MSLNARLIARRQKDLDGFVEYYSDRLERMTGKHIKDLAGIWGRMESRIHTQIKALYMEAGALQDPVKLTTLHNKISRLEALQAQLAADIKLNAAQLQPYYTGILKNQFEDGYYMAAFGLEQAAQVSAVVPILTPAQVLGVLANPWLSDGATYAQRLGANMATFAKGIKDSVAQAVSDGWGWNKTAHEITARTKEGYFNAVRLARTELTRAAGQGASYSYMQNSDILDGKRWNAVLDSRTAPKDAANDGKLYDLDYDTMENLGTAGQRIPNHPHCRCIWSPVLSALGVSTKERIARGKGDSPESWGERIYTKARTYREYAKERGLPDLDDLLAAENPKKYLRPGETLGSLSKQVKRWQPTGGQTITIPTPTWEAIKAAPAAAIPNPVQAQKAATRQEVEKAFPVRLFSNDVEVAEAFYESMENAPKEYRDFAIKHFTAGIDNVQLTPKGGSYYQSSKSGVFLDKGDWAGVRPGVDAVKARRAKGTFIHEVGHGLDYGSQRNYLGRSRYEALSTQYGDESKGFNGAVEKAEQLYKQMKKDANPNFSRMTNEKTKQKAIDKANAAEEWLFKLKKPLHGEYRGYGWDADGKVINQPQYASLSDIIDGITHADINGGYGHGKKYWTDHKGPQKEIFANLFELYVHREAEALAYLEELFPDILTAFNKIIKEV